MPLKIIKEKLLINCKNPNDIRRHTSLTRKRVPLFEIQFWNLADVLKYTFTLPDKTTGKV